LLMKPTQRLQVKNGPVVHTNLTATWDETDIYKYFSFCISQTTGMELTRKLQQTTENIGLFEFLNKTF
jgi:hypothetical protein